MELDALASPEPADRALLASRRHTVVLVAILFAIAAWGAHLQSASGPGTQIVEGHRGTVPLYLSLIVAEWALLRYVVIGIHRKGLKLHDLVSGRWASWKDVVRDLAVGLAFWLAWTAGETLVERFLGPDSAKGIGTLLPQGPLEIGIWVALSLSAGFCEEVVFRGYLQRQFHALSGSAAVGVLGQAAIFGVSHGYQGTRLAITIAILAVAYGLLARWRKSLRPGIVAHAWMDIFGGILARQR